MNKRAFFKELLERKVLILDGATGTELHKRGSLAHVKVPEELNIKFPNIIKEVHTDYFRSRADVVISNTFGANRLKLSEFGLQNQIFEINTAGVKIVKDLANNFNGLVGADIGPLGSYIEPLGALTFEKAYECFAEQAKILNNTSADIIFLETFADIKELKAALLACKENFNGPVVAQMTFAQDGSTVTGTDVLSFLATIESMGADAVGFNCSVGPKDLLKAAKTICEYSSLPVSFKPNAGMPKLVNRETVFPGTIAEFVSASLEAYELGVNMFGGCCGTTPEFIMALAAKLKDKPPKRKMGKEKFFLSSRTKTLDVNTKSFLIIGERINPTNRKKFQTELSANNFSTIRKEAQEQIKSGADILDINMGVPNADEKALIKKAVSEIQEFVSVPICIDSSSLAALEQGLMECTGKPIINSTNGDEDRMEAVFKLAKKYGAAVICLSTDHSGLPKTSQQRLDIAKRIVEYARKVSFPENELFIDFLTLAVSAAPQQALETLSAIKKSKILFPKCRTILGLSNISFGMPQRQIINSTFLKLAKSYGLDAAILNPHEDWSIDDNFAKELLLGNDPNGKKYIEKYAQPASVKKPDIQQAQLPADKKLFFAVFEGNKEEIQSFAKEAVDSGIEPLVLANDIILKALNEVGDKFNKKEFFLPQVMRAAEAAQAAFAYIKPLLNKQSGYSSNKILLATVKGDVHDIGKNIVAAVFESHGWEVLDLGKNVDAQTIIESAKKENCKIIGLSALMTTTMLEMEAVVALRNSNKLNNIKVIIGGAPVTEKFAKEIGADGYGKDAVSAVDIASKLI